MFSAQSTVECGPGRPMSVGGPLLPLAVAVWVCGEQDDEYSERDEGYRRGVFGRTLETIFMVRRYFRRAARPRGESMTAAEAKSLRVGGGFGGWSSLHTQKIR